MNGRPFLYYEIDSKNNAIIHLHSKRQPTYPRALRFNSAENRRMYLEAKKQFIQSTKIPASCDACPLAHEMCDLSIRYGENQCRRIWRKIWEYVK